MNKEIVIPTTIALDHPKTQPDIAICRTPTRTNGHLSQDKKIFYGERHFKPRGYQYL